MSKKKLDTQTAHTAQDLLSIVLDLTANTNERASAIYVTNNATNGVQLSLIEETLSDGSKVFNIEITDAAAYRAARNAAYRAARNEHAARNAGD